MAIDKTVQAVFDRAIYLINWQRDTDGATENKNTQEYRARTVGILNTLLDAVYPASSTYAIGKDGRRPALPDVRGFEDELELDARVLRDILPNGLAARLLAEENPELSNYFQQIYERSLAEARYGAPAVFEDVDGGAPYGGIELGQFGRW